MNWKFSQKGHYVYDKESFKDGMGYIHTREIEYPIQYYSKLSKDGFEYAKHRAPLTECIIIS